MRVSRRCAGVVYICVAYACEEVKGVEWYVLASKGKTKEYKFHICTRKEGWLLFRKGHIRRGMLFGNGQFGQSIDSVSRDCGKV